MEILFDYQINYFSDSGNITNLPFSLFALTQQGLDHKHMNIGNQDSGCLYVGKNTIIGAVADGCTSGLNINKKSVNQVGAFIGSYLAIRISRKLLLKNRHPLNDEFLRLFGPELLGNYKRLLRSLNPWHFEREQIIKNFLLSTIIFFIITEEKYLIAACGDGDVIINDQRRDLNNYSGRYFASTLRDTRKSEGGRNSVGMNEQFNLIEIGNTRELKNIFMATDGFLDTEISEHPIFQNFFFRGLESHSPFCFKDRKTDFRREFLPAILGIKGDRIWPTDDATFIALNRNGSK